MQAIRNAGLVLSLVLASAAGAPAAEPRIAVPPAPIAAPRDQVFAGEIGLAVDASDVDRRVVRVRESITGVGGDLVLL